MKTSDPGGGSSTPPRPAPGVADREAAAGVPQGGGRLAVQALHVLHAGRRQEHHVRVELGRVVQRLQRHRAAVEHTHLPRADHRPDRVQLGAWNAGTQLSSEYPQAGDLYQHRYTGGADGGHWPH